MNKSSYNYYFIFCLSPFPSPIYVNNIIERGDIEETPVKWGKKRYFYHILICKVIYKH